MLIQTKKLENMYPKTRLEENQIKRTNINYCRLSKHHEKYLPHF